MWLKLLRMNTIIFNLNLQMSSNERKKRLSYSSLSRNKAKSCGNFQGIY